MKSLISNPPAASELLEAKQHLKGRRVTAYQSNEELSGFYAKEWLEQGRLLSQREYEKSVNDVTLEQIKAIIPDFLNGAQVIVDTNS